MSGLNIYQWEIAGVQVYHILMWFFIYSFLGWIWESCYVSFKEKKWVNRGFVSGPCLTIYGFGAVSVYLLLKSLPRNIVVLYIGGIIVATVLEYITAVVMEAMFHTSWWDYSEKKFNYQGRICLVSSLFWGVMTVVLFYIFQPFVERITSVLPKGIGELLLSGIILVYTIDFIYAFGAASNLANKIHGLNLILEEWFIFMKESKLYDSADEIKMKLFHLRHFASDKKAEMLLERKEREVMERWDHMHACSEDKELRTQFQSKYHEFITNYLSSNKNQSRIIKRFRKAYPGLGKLTKKRRDQEKDVL